jgi:hypothetical protein
MSLPSVRPNVQAAIEKVNAEWTEVFEWLSATPTPASVSPLEDAERLGERFPEEKTSAARRRIALPPIPPIPLTPLVPVEDWGGDFDVPAVAFFVFEASCYRAAKALNTGDWRAFPEASVR